jgi:ABC-type iron transport system FetAB ATPase subunit
MYRNLLHSVHILILFDLLSCGTWKAVRSCQQLKDIVVFPQNVSIVWVTHKCPAVLICRHFNIDIVVFPQNVSIVWVTHKCPAVLICRHFNIDIVVFSQYASILWITMGDSDYGHILRENNNVNIKMSAN